MSKTSFAMIATIAALLVFQANSMGTIADSEEGNTPLRQLRLNFDVEKTYDLRTISVLGQKIMFKYRVGVKNGKAFNQLIIQTNLGTFTIGNNGIDAGTSKSWSGKYKLFSIRFPPMPSINLNIYASGNFQYSAQYTSASQDSLKLSLSGTLNPLAELAGSSSSLIKLSISIDGVLIGASGDAIVSKSGITKEFKFYGTKSNLVIQAKMGNKPLWKKSIKLFEEWSY